MSLENVAQYLFLFGYGQLSGLIQQIMLILLGIVTGAALPIPANHTPHHFSNLTLNCMLEFTAHLLLLPLIYIYFA